MSKDNIDNVRSRLNIENLESDDRKTLFNKFQQAGGKVIDLDSDVKKLKNVNSRTPNRNSHSVRGEGFTSNPFNDTSQSTKLPNVKAKKKSVSIPQKESMFSYYFVRTSCFFANLFNFSATRFSKKFIKMTLEKAYMHHCYIKSCLANIFQNEESSVLAFRNHMLSIGMIREYEIAYHTYFLFDEADFVALKNVMPFSVDDSEAYFLRIFRKMAFFYSYQGQMQLVLNRMADFYQEFFQEELYEFYKPQKISQTFTFLWKEWYIWLEELINYYWVRFNYKTPYLSKDSFLQFDEIKPIGSLSEYWTNQFKKIQQETVVLEEKKSQEYPDQNIEKGVLLITKYIDFSALYNQFKENKDIRGLFGAKEKLFYTYALVDFFDKEFSLIWNDINFYVDLDGGQGRFDPKKEIKGLNSKLTQFDEMVTEYLRVVRNQTSTGIQGEQEKERQLNKMSFNARQALLVVFEQWVALLSKIRSQRGKHNDIIGNWDEMIIVNKTQEHRILYRYTVSEIVEFAYGFSCAIVWLLKYKELSGMESNVSVSEILPPISQ